LCPAPAESLLHPIVDPKAEILAKLLCKGLPAGPGGAASLISVLYLCSAVMQPTMGKLSTLFGPRRIFLIGTVILLVGGVVGATAPSLVVLLVSRALIGIGSSAAYPTAMALIRKRADDGGTGTPSRVLGNLAIAAQITAVFGLPLGGVLVGAFGWRALFVVNIPLALLTIAFTLAGVAKDPPSARKGFEGLATALDIPGVILFAAAITSLLVFLSDLTSPQWRLAAAAAVLAAALIFREQRAGSPLIDTRMLAKNLPLQRTYLRQTLASLGVYAALYGVSQWMEQSAHLSASAVGIILLPLSVLSIVASWMASVRGWVRWPLIVAGAALIVVSCGSLSFERRRPAGYRALGAVLALLCAGLFAVRDTLVRWASGVTRARQRALGREAVLNRRTLRQGLVFFTCA